MGLGVLGDTPQVKIGQLVGGHVVGWLRGRRGGSGVGAGSAVVRRGGRRCGGTAPALAARQDALPSHEKPGNMQFMRLVGPFAMKKFMVVLLKCERRQ